MRATEITTHQLDGLMQPLGVDREFLVHATYLNCYLKLSLAAHKWARATKVSTTAISGQSKVRAWERSCQRVSLAIVQKLQVRARTEVASMAAQYEAKQP
jgi:hypothetical protein